MIEEAYVSFETARLLKEKGFNESCNRVYEGPNLKYTNFPISPLMSLGELGGFHPRQLYVTNDELGDIVYTAPTQQMAMRWLREVYKIYIDISPTYCEVEKTIHFIWQILDSNYDVVGDCEIFYGKYETACEEAIKYCLENLI